MAASADGIHERIRQSYDREALNYVNRTELQKGNLAKLRSLLHSLAGNPKGKWLDIGCGGGGLPDSLHSSGMLNGVEYAGIDASLGMIDVCRSRSQAWNVDPNQFQVCKAEQLSFGDDQFDVLFSNSVLHWLTLSQHGDALSKAFREAYRVARPRAWLAVSVAAEGTARRFQTVYRRLSESWRTRDEYNALLYHHDPIGCMKLHSLVDEVRQAGFIVQIAQMMYEPVLYKQTEDYALAVKAYGIGAYLAPWPAVSWDQLWNELTDAFVREVGETDYLHDQYMLYVIACKAG